MFGQIFSILVKNGEQEEASPEVTESPNLALSGDLSCQVIRLRSMASKPVLQGSEELLVFSQLSAFLISVFFFFFLSLSLQTQSYITYSWAASGYAIYTEGNSTFGLSSLSVGTWVVYMPTQSTSRACQNENLNPTGSGWGLRVPFWQPQVRWKLLSQDGVE